MILGFLTVITVREYIRAQGGVTMWYFLYLGLSFHSKATNKIGYSACAVLLQGKP